MFYAACAGDGSVGKVLAFQDGIQHLDVGADVHGLGGIQAVQLVFKGGGHGGGVGADLGLDLVGVVALDAALLHAGVGGQS